MLGPWMDCSILGVWPSEASTSLLSCTKAQAPTPHLCLSHMLGLVYPCPWPMDCKFWLSCGPASSPWTHLATGALGSAWWPSPDLLGLLRSGTVGQTPKCLLITSLEAFLEYEISHGTHPVLCGEDFCKCESLAHLAQILISKVEQGNISILSYIIRNIVWLHLELSVGRLGEGVKYPLLSPEYLGLTDFCQHRHKCWTRHWWGEVFLKKNAFPTEGNVLMKTKNFIKTHNCFVAKEYWFQNLQVRLH